MKSRFATLGPMIVFSLLTVVASCAKDDSSGNGNPNDQAGPVENPTPMPTPTPTATPGPAFQWASITFTDESDLVPTFAECENRMRFTVDRSGHFTARDTCSSDKVSGELKSHERTEIDRLVRNVSESEARAKLKCKTRTEDIFILLQELTLRTRASSFLLWRAHDKTECVAGDPEDVKRIIDYMYQLRSTYMNVDPPH